MIRTYQPKKLQRKKEHGFKREWLLKTAAKFSHAEEQKGRKAAELLIAV